MPQSILSKLIISLVLAGVAAVPTYGGGNASEKELALGAVGAGSTEEMARRIFKTPVTVVGPEERARAVAGLPGQVIGNRITDGKLLTRVRASVSLILQIHNLGHNVELFLYKGDEPQASLVSGCLLVLSDTLARYLNDAELSGVIAHEIGHRYFTDEAAAAQKAEDMHGQRVVELKCDTVALLTLEVLDFDPTEYVRGLLEIDRVKVKKGYVVPRHATSHPTTAQRWEFAASLLRLFD